MKALRARGLSALVAGAWRARALTVGFLVAYGVWTGAGLVCGVRNAYRPEVTTPARITLALTKEAGAWLEGRVAWFWLWTYSWKTFLRGAARLRFEQERATPRVLELWLAFANLGVGDRFVVRDLDGGARHEVAGVTARRVLLRLPFAARTHRLAFEPSAAGGEFRVLEVRLLDEPGRGIEDSVDDGPARRGPGWAVHLGSGWWSAEQLPDDLDAPGLQVVAKPLAHLVVRVERPGRYRVRLPLAPLFPETAPPEVAVDGRPVASRWAARGLLELEAELGVRTVLSLQGSPPHVDVERDLAGAEHLVRFARRATYVLRPAGIVVEPR